jgi:predicted dehydrogenase
MESTERARVAVIGLGGVSLGGHVPDYLKDEGVELVAGADPVPEARERALSLGVPRVYDDYRRMLDSERVQFVSVLTPMWTHGDICVECAARGLHILCEKPLATDWAMAQRIAEAVEREGVKLRVSYNYRFFVDALAARQDIVAGEIGPVYYIDFAENANFEWRSSPGRKALNLPLVDKPFWGHPEGHPPATRLMIIDKSTHYIDMARYLTGADVESVYAQLGYHGGHPEVGENFSSIVMVMTNGTRVHDLHNWGCHFWDRRGVVLTAATKVEGEQGTIRIERTPDGSPGTYRLYRDNRLLKETAYRESSDKGSYGSSFLELVRAVRQGDQPMNNSDETLHEMRVIEACYQSARTNQVVRIDQVELH